MISVEGTAVVFIVVVVVDGIVVILQVVVHFQGQAAGQFQAVGSSRGGAILRFHWFLKLWHNLNLNVISSTLQEWLETTLSSTEFSEREGFTKPADLYRGIHPQYV